MNKLREKFGLLDEYDEGGVIYCHNEEQCEQITDDFSVRFAIFIRTKCLIDNCFLYYFYNNNKYNEIELLEYFKNNIYGKE